MFHCKKFTVFIQISTMGAYFYSVWIFRVGANPVTHFHKVYFIFYLQKEETSLLSLHTGIYALIFGEGGGGVLSFLGHQGGRFSRLDACSIFIMILPLKKFQELTKLSKTKFHRQVYEPLNWQGGRVR